MGSANRILIHSPDGRVGRGLESGLTAVGCLATRGMDADALLAVLDAAAADAVVVCLLADGEGLALLDRIVADYPEVPALVAAPAAAQDLHLLGLEHGAADYLVLPCGGEEARLRIATALYRAAVRPAEPRLRGLQFDQESGRLGDGASWTVLTPAERQVFSLLCRHGDRPVSKQRLKSLIAEQGRVTDNAVEVLIHRLRAKAGRLGVHIRTFRGAGYLLERA